MHVPFIVVYAAAHARGPHDVGAGFVNARDTPHARACRARTDISRDTVKRALLHAHGFPSMVDYRVSSDFARRYTPFDRPEQTPDLFVYR